MSKSKKIVGQKCLKSNGMDPRASSGLKKRCEHRGIKPGLRVRRLRRP